IAPRRSGVRAPSAPLHVASYTSQVARVRRRVLSRDVRRAACDAFGHPVVRPDEPTVNVLVSVPLGVIGNTPDSGTTGCQGVRRSRTTRYDAGSGASVPVSVPLG